MQIGFVLYPNLTALDLVGPYEVLSRLPGASVALVAESHRLVPTQGGLTIAPTCRFEDCPPLDVLCVPGGPGQVDWMEDPNLLDFLRRQSVHAQWVTAVCTGTLLLGAAGLLQGYRATTHWRALDCLRDLGAIPTRKRVVADRNRITASGVTAGIDLGLFLAAMISGEQVAQGIQLQLEYDPQPPFQCGSPDRADPDLLEWVEDQSAALHLRRLEQVRRIGSALHENES